MTLGTWKTGEHALTAGNQGGTRDLAAGQLVTTLETLDLAAGRLGMMLETYQMGNWGRR